MNENLLILSLSFRPQQQQQVNSSVLFNSISSTLHLQSRGSAVENIYQIDGGGDGGEYEYCPWALKLRPMTCWPGGQKVDKFWTKHINTYESLQFRRHSRLLPSPRPGRTVLVESWEQTIRHWTKNVLLQWQKSPRKNRLCPTLAEKPTTSPREYYWITLMLQRWMDGLWDSWELQYFVTFNKLRGKKQIT